MRRERVAHKLPVRAACPFALRSFLPSLLLLLRRPFQVKPYADVSMIPFAKL